MDPTVTHQPQNPALDAAIASYLQAAEAGHAPDRAAYLAAHLTIADELTRFFHDQDEINRLTQPASTRLGPGSLLGSYRIVREIGRGGMGIVYEAIHEALKKRVALKLLPLSPTSSGSHLERFLREAQTAAALHHTNIVPVFDVGQVDGLPFYAMQFIEGKTLDKLSAISSQLSANDKTQAMSGSPLPSAGEGLGVWGERLAEKKHQPTKSHYKHIAQLGRQAALGLAYAHERGVIHRDIKPSNLILDQQGVLWITDFGLAKRLDDVTLTAAGQLLGTPRYMSPEQASAAKNPVDHRTDIYSLGATLYELLVGRPAHDGQTPPEVVNQILTRDPVSPHRIDSQVPRDLETVVMKAMAKTPADRYASAAELAADLERFGNGEPVQARRVGVLGRTWRWAKREPKVAGLVGAVVSTLSFGIIASCYLILKLEISASDMLDTISNASFKAASFEESLYNYELAMLWHASLLDNPNTDVNEQAISRLRLSLFMRYHAPQDEYDDYLARFPLHADLEHQPFRTLSVDGSYDLKLAFHDKDQDQERNIGRFDSTKGESSIEPSAKKSIGSSVRYDKRLQFGLGNVLTIGGRGSRHNRITKQSIVLSPLLHTEYWADEHDRWDGNLLRDTYDSCCSSNYLYVLRNTHPAPSQVMFCWNITEIGISNDDYVKYANLYSGHRIKKGEYVQLTQREAIAGWNNLQNKYPYIFTLPIDKCLEWHLKADFESCSKKHQHAALFAANFDCRDRPNEPHPFVARGRLFTVLGDYDKAAADFAMAWKLGGTGWVKSECRRMVRDAWRVLQTVPKHEVGKSAEIQAAYRKIQIATTYLEQDPRTLAVALLGKPPLHRLALAMTKHRLSMEWDERDRQAIGALLP